MYYFVIHLIIKLWEPFSHSPCRLRASPPSGSLLSRPLQQTSQVSYTVPQGFQEHRSRSYRSLQAQVQNWSSITFAVFYLLKQAMGQVRCKIKGVHTGRHVSLGAINTTAYCYHLGQVTLPPCTSFPHAKWWLQFNPPYWIVMKVEE